MLTAIVSVGSPSFWGPDAGVCADLNIALVPDEGDPVVQLGFLSYKTNRTPAAIASAILAGCDAAAAQNGMDAPGAVLTVGGEQLR